VTRTAISGSARRATMLVAVALLALGALAGSASAQSYCSGCHVDGISYDVTGFSDSMHSSFVSGEPTTYIRLFVPWDEFETYNSSSGCVATYDPNGDNAKISTIEGSGATPIIVFGDGFANGYGDGRAQPNAQDEVCGAQGLMETLSWNHIMPAGGILFEPFNEPDNEGISPFVAGDYVGDAEYGAASVNLASSLHILAGTFVHPDPNAEPKFNCGTLGSISYTDCYYVELSSQNFLQYVYGWSVHNYDDPTTSQNVNWCYYTNGSFSGCQDNGISAWRGWLLSNHLSLNNTWVTETGDPAGWIPGGPTAKSTYTNARSATAVEYFSQWTAHTLWYTYGASDWCNTPGWDSDVLTYWPNYVETPRAAYYVVGLHQDTNTAINNGAGADYVQPYYSHESCPN
jgi:hypothetical protein